MRDFNEIDTSTHWKWLRNGFLRLNLILFGIPAQSLGLGLRAGLGNRQTQPQILHSRVPVLISSQPPEAYLEDYEATEINLFAAGTRVVQLSGNADDFHQFVQDFLKTTRTTGRQGHTTSTNLNVTAKTLPNFEVDQISRVEDK
ncbi:hypothetical protein K435DRAFT_854878 [Dendrothele bispora CBS 962.96]|uniref:Uncharacterized protein n=1 Tax=Dendrothele bispora (strain CBS 962.96) TaxID=1314807 RepID=A0A4S8MCK4_DENBC|nr:hypothetical protein K435DRAFT_854878 [Dendrothele bispora CBS 962.96]